MCPIVVGVFRWLALSALVVLVDQATKYAVVQSFAVNESMQVMPFFNLVLVYNPGAAFSLLSHASGWQREFFIAVAVLASGWVIYLLRKHPEQALFACALSLILGGAVGNLIDRLLYGAVVDFLDFHLYGHHWPAFNVADSAITCGAALLIWDSVRSRKGAAAAAD
jgi:signal peptidase II